MNVPHTLETPRLLLRRLIPEDIEPFYAFMSNPACTRHMAFMPEQKTYDGVQAMMDAVIQSYATTDPIFVLAITRKADGHYLGSLGASPLEEDTVEVFYTLLPEYQGQGYASEGGQRLLRYLFEYEQMWRVAAYVFPDNHTSIRVAERLGMHHIADVVRDGYPGKLFRIEHEEWAASQHASG